MKWNANKMYLYCFIFIILIGITGQTFAVKNATRQIDPANKANKIRGAKATITWTNPNLNSKPFSAHRTTVVQDNPFWAYIEVGWWKKSGNPSIEGIIVFQNLSGHYQYYFPLTATTHTYQAENIVGTNHYNVSVDGVSITNVNIDFALGDRSIAGSEVSNGSATAVDEYMGGTEFNSLAWLKYKSSTGTYVWKPWNSNLVHVINAPYYVSYFTPTLFITGP